MGKSKGIFWSPSANLDEWCGIYVGNNNDAIEYFK